MKIEIVGSVDQINPENDNVDIYGTLQGSKWLKQRIGVLSSSATISQLDPSQITAWQKATRTDWSAIVDNSSNKLEFVREELSTHVQNYGDVSRDRLLTRAAQY